ncbi:DUF4270 family protein [Hymenobacter sp. HMF4947]|uniref:DUF4270 family protein n=1 Tax=Hymenobacter ginkgonis TaxID=2682976 RepID=A0A7K1TCX9_9BACT|nr:DUF4270 family protein [Hymenobacter ginkgonis]
MMSWPAKPLAFVATLLVGLGSLSGCMKGNELNVDLPGTAAIGTNYVDLPITASTVRQQPIQTLKAEHFLAGRLFDNLTGNTEARAVLSLLPSVNDSLPGRYTSATSPDSVVITLGFDQVYGSTSTPAKLDVLELATKLDERTVYNSASVAPVKATIGQNLVVPLNKTKAVRQAIATSTTDSITVQVPDPTVRLVVQRQGTGTNPNYPNVSSTFANSLFRQLQVASLTQAQLDAILAGIIIAPSQGYNGAVLSFSRVVSGAINIYFHPAASQKRHSYQLYFGPSPSGSGPGAPTDPRYYTQLSTDFQTSSALSALQGSAPGTRLSSAAAGGVTYVQEGTGLGTALSFVSPQFTSLLARPGIAINRAELILPIQPYSNALLSNPARLYALEVDAKNQPLQRVTGINSVDRVVQGDGAVQQGRGSEAIGLPYSASTTNIYYDVLITSYLQAYLNDPTAATLGGLPDALVLTPALSTATSLTLNRAALTASAMRLRVYYSQLRQ